MTILPILWHFATTSKKTLISSQFKTNPPTLVFFIPIMADNLENTYFRRVSHMLPYAQTFVIVSYLNDTHCRWSIVGQAIQIEPAFCLLLWNELCSDGQMRLYHFVHSLFQPFHIIFRRTLLQPVIQFTLLRSMCADTERPQPNRRIIVWLTMCSQVCMGGNSSLLCSLSCICCSSILVLVSCYFIRI